MHDSEFQPDDSHIYLNQAALENGKYGSRNHSRWIHTEGLLGRYAGILTFMPLTESPGLLLETLRQHNIICALRGGGIRLSPHFYTPRKKLFTALNVLDY